MGRKGRNKSAAAVLSTAASSAAETAANGAPSTNPSTSVSGLVSPSAAVTATTGTSRNRSPASPSSPSKRRATISAPKTSTSAKSSQQVASTGAKEKQLHYVPRRSWHSRLWIRLQGPLLLLGCVTMGGIFGFLVGAGWGFESKAHRPAWKQALANRIRSTVSFQLLTFQGPIWNQWMDRFADWAEEVVKDVEKEAYVQNPSHPRVFAVLREAVIREEGGYVHPDLGFMVPAPCGAARGIGMVRNAYHYCQVHCLPGQAEEKREFEIEQEEASARNTTVPLIPPPNYQQEEVLIRVPLKFQMTRSTALDTLLSIIPADVQKTASLHELDDSVLLVMALAHERGVGRYSKWVAYVTSLPPQPSCGYSIEVRPYILDAIAAYDDLNLDVQGWPAELIKATSNADKIAESLDDQYGAYLSTPEGVSSLDNIKWALCHVASRAIAGSEKHGALRLVPLVDLTNHDVQASGYVEVTGKERIHKGDYLDAREDLSGAFAVRSMRLGRRKPLRKGQELLVNYNVPSYSPLDWLVSMGFVPPERWGRWQKIEPVLPRVRTDGPFAARSRQRTRDAEREWKEREPELLEHLKSLDLLT